MTTRPGNAALEYLAGTVTKRLCRLIDVLTLYGSELHFTTHDRQITDAAGVTYQPISIGQVEGEYTESAFRGSQASAVGLIDGTNVVINDIAGGRYRGAKVVERIVDWRNPSIVVSEQHRTITAIRYNNKSWTAQLESISSRLRKPQAARFRGQFTSRCPYRLGGRYCGASIDTQTFAGAEVASVSNARTTFTTNAWPYTPSGANWFRDGEFVWMWDAPTNIGNITSAIAPGDTTLVDATKSWTVDELVGQYVRVATANPERFSEWFVIKSNTATTITIAGVFESTHNSATFFDVCPPSDKHGLVSPVGRSENASYEIELFFPTNIPIVVGESGILRVGCDGTFGTCKEKFSNQLNFGGLDVEAPDASEITETPEEAQ